MAGNATEDERYPDDVLYHAAHDWVRVDGDEAVAGITWYAQDKLGEIVYFDPPEAGDTVIEGEAYAEVESVKAVSEVVSPMSGEVLDINVQLEASPDLVNKDPYGDGWLVKVRLGDPSEVDGLMAPDDYREIIEAGEDQ